MNRVPAGGGTIDEAPEKVTITMEIRRRKNVRLKCFDYSSNRMYFITICSKDREEIFCKIENGEVILSEIGYVIKGAWESIPQIESGVDVLDFCIMPNHIHGVLHLEQADITLGMIIQRFKARVSHTVGNAVWQRNYYEHVIRDENEYRRIGEYIAGNPLNWETDTEHMP